MRKFILGLVMAVTLMGASLPSYVAQTDPPDNNGGGGDDNTTFCVLSHNTCMNNANFVYAVCLAGGSTGCYERAVQSYNTCMNNRGCQPRTGLCFGSRTGTKSCS